MARQSRSELDGLFAALADPTRRAILARLADGDAYMTELVEQQDMSFAAVSRHVHVLEDVGLMNRTKEGRKIRCQFIATPLDDVLAWTTHYRALWDNKLGSLGEFLEQQ